MPLKKLAFKPGLNQENTRYTNENGWWSADKVRFRQGTPETIGGWVRLSSQTFLGICRALHNWVSLAGRKYTGVGTHLKYYIENGGTYYDVTPLRASATLTNPFSVTSGSATVTVTDTDHGADTGDYVTFSGGAAVGGLTITGTFPVTVVDVNNYTIEFNSAATSTTTGGGTVTADYDIPPGFALESPTEGWGNGGFGLGVWGVGTSGVGSFRLWAHSNFGEDLVFNYRGGPLYTWSASGADPLLTRGVLVSSLPGANNVPTVVNSVLVSDVSRFVLVFGCNDIGSATLDTMLIRWSDQESMVDWTPAATNQSGSLRLSRGSEIVAHAPMRQEVLVLTDVAAYSLQYLGPPAVWGAQLLADNISIIGPKAVATATGAAYWMGTDKFYVYNGQVQPLKCDLLRHVYDNLNRDQAQQVFAGTVTQFNEVWWFYPTGTSTIPDSYVIYNYAENVWIMGTLPRYAWSDSGFAQGPIAAGQDRLVLHEVGTDDNYSEVPAPLNAFIESAEFDVDDGDRFAFVRRLLPDVTFGNSTAENPALSITLYPMKSSGSGFGSSVGGSETGAAIRTATGVVERFTDQIFIRVRGRQLVLRLESNQLGTSWQAGSMRLDIRQDGQRG